MCSSDLVPDRSQDVGDLELDANEFFVDIPDDVGDGDDPGGREDPSGVADFPLAPASTVRPASAPKSDDCIAGDDRQAPLSSDHGADGPSVLSAATQEGSAGGDDDVLPVRDAGRRRGSDDCGGKAPLTLRTEPSLSCDGDRPPVRRTGIYDDEQPAGRAGDVDASARRSATPDGLAGGAG